VFLGDVPDELQFREASKVLCPFGPLNSCLKLPIPDNDRKAALSVWQFIREVEKTHCLKTKEMKSGLTGKFKKV
jgi:hypothetical protein